jgi:hypothetical protein
MNEGRKRDAENSAWEIIGKQIGGPPLSEAEHFLEVRSLRRYFDMRDLGAVLEHEEPLPHPAGDQAQ